MGTPSVSPWAPSFSGRSGMVAAYPELKQEPSRQEMEALDFLNRVLLEQQIEMRAESGEMSIANNFAMAHSRSAFVDGNVPEKRRLVLRAWLELPPWRKRLPIHLGHEFHQFENEGGRLGVDPQPGREKRVAPNEFRVSDSTHDLFREMQKFPRVTA